jgi:hypothetical protein
MTALGRNHKRVLPKAGYCEKLSGKHRERELIKDKGLF